MTDSGTSRREVLRNGSALGIGALVATMTTGAADAATPGVTMAATSSGTQQFFLAVDGIDGPSTVKGHHKQIPVLSYSWGISNTSTISGTGGGAGKPVEGPFELTLPTSVATPALIAACLTGKHIATVTLHGIRPSGKTQVEYLTITLTDVLVSTLNQAESNGHPPVDRVQLLYQSIKYVEDQQQMTFGF